MISLTSPHRTAAHDWPAGPKLAALLLASTGLVFLSSPLALAVMAALTAGLYLMGGRRFFLAGLRAMRMVLPFVVIVGLWQALAGQPSTGLVLALRIVTAFGMANLVTMTTRLDDMMDVIDRLFRPLRRLGLNTEVLRLAIPMVIRSVPALTGRLAALRLAWRARSRRAVGWPILMPCALACLDDADHMADALKARGGVTPAAPATPEKDPRSWNTP